MNETPKASNLYIGLDVKDAKLRRILMQLLASWGFLPVPGRLIDEKCSMIFADTWDRASFWEVESEAEWDRESIVTGIGFDISQRQIQPVINTETADDFRMTVYYWLGNFWMFERIKRGADEPE